VVVHGDCTTHNVLVDDLGGVQTPTGVIDFGLACVDAPLADIGFGLWRSGRPYQDAINLDASRVKDFVAGYAKVSPLPTSAAHAISVYVRARGVQQAVKAQMISRPPAAMLAERIRWLATHEDDPRTCIASALRPHF
jgi:Ser/Thr protein kinase RdoA (MazF antagonist)